MGLESSVVHKTAEGLHNGPVVRKDLVSRQKKKGGSWGSKRVFLPGLPGDHDGPPGSQGVLSRPGKHSGP